jgi:hypothetical protein
VLECAGKHQVLIFVHSRKETAKTARFLKEEALREDKLASFMRVPALRPLKTLEKPHSPALLTSSTSVAALHDSMERCCQPLGPLCSGREGQHSLKLDRAYNSEQCAAAM